MPPITSGHILVTGASGFIAAWICTKALDKGFRVTGTVRTESKGEYLVKLLGKGFDYAIVKDIADETAFEAVIQANNFDGVVHTASPVDFTADDPNELIEPALKGTVGILKSITKAGGSVKRVVITSSNAAIMRTTAPPGTVFTEDDWNTVSPKLVEEQGRAAPPVHKYMASKVLAERAAWDYVANNNSSFDLITMNPSYVYGPVIHQVKSFDSLNTTVAMLAQVWQGGKKKEDLPGPAGNHVDVRDVAAAHVEALVRDVQGRFLLSNGPVTWQDTISILNRNYHLGLVECSQEENEAVKAKQNRSDGSKARAQLGINYISLEQCVKDTYESVMEKEKRGWD